MKKNYSLRLLFAAVTFAFVTSASAQLQEGVLVLNEGNFGVDNAGISFIGATTFHSDLYAEANNNIPLGNTAQSMGFYGDNAYVVLNGSNALAVLDRHTLRLSAIMPVGLFNPRHIIFSENKAYISCWTDAGNPDDDTISVIDLLSMSVSLRIPTPEGPEKLLVVGNKLYVANQGGYGYGNSVSVIDLATDAVIATIPTGDVPNSMVESGGTLYVLCGGKPSWTQDETAGKLLKINVADNSVTSTIDFPEMHPSNLKIYGDYLFYSVDSNVYKMVLNATQLPQTPLVELEEVGVYGIYGMEIIDDKLYIGDAGNYVDPGKAYVYSVDGTLLEDYQVGRLPNGFYKAQIDTQLGTKNQNDQYDLAVYPNPASDLFYINTEKPADIHIFDLSGRLVKTAVYSPSGISVSDLNSGIYLVEITIDSQKSFKRISVK